MNKQFSWLFTKIQKDIPKIAMAALLQSFLNLSGIIYAILFRNLLDSAVAGSVSLISTYTSIFFLVLLLQTVINAVLRNIKEQTTVNVGNKLKKDLLENILFRDFSYVSGIHSAEWMNKISNDADIIAKNVVNLIPNLCSIVLHILVALFVLVDMVPDFMGFLFFLIIIALIFEFFFYRYIKVLHKKVQEKDGKLREFIHECLSCLTLIKAYGKEETILNKVEGHLNDYKDARIRKNNYSIIMNFFFGLGINGALILSGICCAYAILDHRISYGTFLAVIQIITQIRTPIASAYSIIPNYYSMIGSIERVSEIENQLLDLCVGKGADGFDYLEMDNVSFSYPNEEKYVIKNLSLQLKRGEFIGVCGPSGCGKSTIMKLLLALYQPDTGTIKIGCQNIEHQLNAQDRTLFAYVPQNNLLMMDSIKDSICFGEEYIETKMNKAIKLSCCEEFISQIPEGINYKLREKGGGLSEGQIQRIAIARAIYSERPILLLDEITSSLNEELEENIINNLKTLSQKTIVFITHRKKTLRYADQLVKCEEKEGEYNWSLI